MRFDHSNHWPRGLYSPTMDDNPYQAPQSKPGRAEGDRGVPTWRKVVGGAILLAIVGPFIVPPFIYLLWLLFNAPELR
jgi:hypothetical protein